jgi:5'-3' exonuclease
MEDGAFGFGHSGSFSLLRVFPLKAPGEAEAELAHLNNIGAIDAILSDDVDNFLFGAKIVIRKCVMALHARLICASFTS